MFEATKKFIQRHRKKRNSSKNTFDVLRPVNILSNIVGYRVFEYPRGHPRPKLSFLYVILLCIIYYGGWYMQSQFLNTNKVFNLQGTIYKITGGINQIVLSIIVFMGFYHSKSFKLSIRRIHEIDVTLQALGSPASFNSIYRKTIALIFFAFFYTATIITGNIIALKFYARSTYRMFKLMVVVFLNAFNQSLELTLIIEFLTVVNCIKSEFQRANDLLSDIDVLPLSSIAMELLDYGETNDPFLVNKSLIPSSNKLFTVIPSSRRLRSHLRVTSHEIIRSRRLLQTIRQVYLELYRVSKSLSAIYGMQIALEIGLCILYTTYCIYTLYDKYHHEMYGSAILLIQAVGTCIICFNNSIKIVGINYTCEKTLREAERVNEIIYTFYGECTDYEIQEEVDMFSVQIAQCRPTYSTIGLYSLNCKYICSCIGVITTYVVIMIQVTDTITEEVS